jgi:hypothetical protein
MHSIKYVFPFLGTLDKNIPFTPLWNNNKLLSQEIKTLSLAPLPTFHPPLPYLALWNLTPPSLFLRGQSTRSDVYILLMICIIAYKNQAPGL